MTRPLPTVEQVQAAYEKLKPLGVVPTRGEFFVDFSDGETVGCCALSAVYLTEEVADIVKVALVNADLAPLGPLCSHVGVWAADQFGVRAASGFSSGFDDERITGDITAYEHGRAVARAVFGDDKRAGDAG